MIFRVAIIGAGNLGSRHLQALKLTKKDISIIVCEPNEQAKKTARERYDQYPENSKVHTIEFINDYKDLPTEQDLVIIATNAHERFRIAQWLVENLCIKYLLLEKVVFQKISDFGIFSECLKKKNVKAWVNCPRRMFQFYKNIKEQVSTFEPIDMTVNGSLWGMGCNTIHMLDLYEYITGSQQYEYDNSFLEPGYFDSKRAGYYEFSGKVIFRTDRGNLIVKCVKEGDIPLTITLESDSFYVEIDESSRRAVIQKGSSTSDRQVEEASVDINYQSNLTNIVVEQLIETGECELTLYEDSVDLHKVLLSCFLDHINKYSDVEVCTCPIT